MLSTDTAPSTTMYVHGVGQGGAEGHVDFYSCLSNKPSALLPQSIHVRLWNTQP